MLKSNFYLRLAKLMPEKPIWAVPPLQQDHLNLLQPPYELNLQVKWLVKNAYFPPLYRL